MSYKRQWWLGPDPGGSVPAPVADFSANVVSGASPLAVSFTDLSTNNPTSWLWNFGDENTSAEQNPNHTYAYPGTFTVALTATNAAGDSTETKVGYITVAWLLLDQFTTDAAAPLSTPRACEPGPGEIAISQVDGNNFSIASSKLTIAARPSNGWKMAASSTASRTRATGLAVFAQAYVQVNRICRVGFGTQVEMGTLIWNGSFGARDNSDVSNCGVPYSVPFTGVVGIILRSAGSFHLAKIGSDWTLLYVGEINTSNPTGGASIGVYSATVGDTFDDLKSAKLGAPFNDDYGIATQRLNGARNAGDTFTHIANCWLGATVTTVPSSGQLEIQFRKQDVNNYWQVTVDSSGNVDLDEIVGGNPPVQRGTGTGVVNGNRVKVLCRGTNIYVFVADVLKISYTSAANFATATAGKLETLGTGGAVSEIISWPYVLSGTAAAVLNGANP